jgi:hypothetical protein
MNQLEHKFFIEPRDERERIIRDKTNIMMDMILDGHSVAFAAKNVGVSWCYADNRKMILQDEIFYNVYLQYMAKTNKIYGKIRSDAYQRRGSEFVSKLVTKFRTA